MLSPDQFLKLFAKSASFEALIAFLKAKDRVAARAEGLAGSSAAVIAAASTQKVAKSFLFLLPDKESAAYFFNDLENLLGERDKAYEDRSSFFFPSSYKKPDKSKEEDKAGILLRAEVMNRLSTAGSQTLIVSYPEAFAEKIISRKSLKKTPSG